MVGSVFVAGRESALGTAPAQPAKALVAVTTRPPMGKERRALWFTLSDSISVLTGQ